MVCWGKGGGRLGFHSAGRPTMLVISHIGCVDMRRVTLSVTTLLASFFSGCCTFMNIDALIRVVSLCVVLAGAETLHGIARTVLVVPRIGKDRAVKLSAFTGSILAFAICWLLVPPISLVGPSEHVLLGFVLAAFMATFDLAIGKMVMRKPWRKLVSDFDPRSGNYLGFGLAFLLLAPLLVSLLRGQGS